MPTTRTLARIGALGASSILTIVVLLSMSVPNLAWARATFYGSYLATAMSECDGKGTPSNLADDTCADDNINNTYTVAFSNVNDGQYHAGRPEKSVHLLTGGNIRYYLRGFDPGYITSGPDANQDWRSGDYVGYRARRAGADGCAQLKFTYDGPRVGDMAVVYRKLTSSSYGNSHTGIKHHFYDADGDGTFDRNGAERGYYLNVGLYNTAYSTCTRGAYLFKVGGYMAY